MDGDIGNVGWTRDDMRAAYTEFKDLYKNRPMATNENGMKAPHAFLTWFMLRQCAPTLIVESGVWRGQGTWFIEQACPKADIVCLDVDLSPVTYRAANAEYIESDFDIVDFSGRDLSSALCFFDDHQNAVARVQQMLWKGFRTAIFEDNYPAGVGDCYSLKQALSGVGQAPPPKQDQRSPSLVKRLRGKGQAVQDRPTVPANTTHKNGLMSRLKTYYEGPPLLRLDQTRWGAAWTNDLYPTKPALFSDSEADAVMRDEAPFYTWMCFVELDMA